MLSRLLGVVCLLSLIATAGCKSICGPCGTGGLHDRQEIINVLSAYPHYFDEKELDNFLGLFTDDVAFEWYMAGEKVGDMKGKKTFGDVIGPRMDMFSEQGIIRRHTNVNIFIVSQTDSEAHVRMGFVLHSVKDMKELTLISTGTYEGWLVKQNNRWLINRWIDRVDLDIRPGEGGSGTNIEH